MPNSTFILSLVTVPLIVPKKSPTFKIFGRTDGLAVGQLVEPYDGLYEVITVIFSETIRARTIELGIVIVNG